MARKSFTRKQKSNILIVCEGTTEEKYLNALKSVYRLPTVKIEVKNAEGGSAQEIIDIAKRAVTYEKKKGKDTQFEEIYCVFDNDNKNMNTEIFPAVNSMYKEGFNPIYSNMCFEMWLGMHFEDFPIKKYNNPSDVENKLKYFDSTFHKTKYRIENYTSNISTAVDKSNTLISKNFDYPKTITELSINPYTNMAKLIERFEQEKNK